MAVFCSLFVFSVIFGYFDVPILDVFKSHIDAGISLITSNVANEDSIKWLTFRVHKHYVFSSTGSSDKTTRLLIKISSDERFSGMSVLIIDPNNRAIISRFRQDFDNLLLPRIRFPIRVFTDQILVKGFGLNSFKSYIMFIKFYSSSFHKVELVTAIAFMKGSVFPGLVVCF